MPSPKKTGGSQTKSVTSNTRVNKKGRVQTEKKKKKNALNVSIMNLLHYMTDLQKKTKNFS